MNIHEDKSESAGSSSRLRWIDGATRRKRAVASSAVIQTTSRSSERKIDLRVHADDRTSPVIIDVRACVHLAVNRKELQNASRKPAVSQPLLADERAQRSTSPETSDSAGSTARRTFPIDALIPAGSQRPTSTMAIPTKGTRESARKKATSAAALLSSAR